MIDIDFDKVIAAARQVLAVPAISGKNDNHIWDTTQRLVKNIDVISSLKEVRTKNFPLDKFCLTAAGYFYQAGFAKYARTHNISPNLVLADTAKLDLTDHSTEVVSDKLNPIVSDQKITKINRIIAESSNRFTDFPEAMVLSDAKSLDDMGAIGILNEARSYICHGKSISELLQSWKRKIEYQYWQARLKEGFRFDTVRQLAAQRFETVKIFMTQLEIEHSCRDFEEISTTPLSKLQLR